jgi:UDP-2,4-diacetamido-2,4,6-trideoxy-beta-L-altropyranose hydrolase
MGGSDPRNVTLQVVRALARIGRSDLLVRVVAGGANPHLPQLRSECLAHGAELVEDPPDMPELMASADLAISAAGSTCWELCFLGVPIIAISVASNQTSIAKGLARAGAALDGGSHSTLSLEELAAQIESLVEDAALRSSMRSIGMALVDGQGSRRLVRRLRETDARAAS